MAQFTQNITTNGNEGYWAGSWFVNGSWWQTGRNGFGDDLYSAGRFTNVSVPYGATITSAYLKLYGYANESGDAFTRIYGIDEDNTVDLTSDPVSRPRTTAYTQWNFNVINLNQLYTIDITSLIQEIVNRAGWGSSNALAVIHVNDGTPTSNFRHFKNWHGDSSYPVGIEINYQLPAHLIEKSLTYRIVRPQTPLTKMLRYSIKDMETDPQPFSGLKVAKAGHNAVNAKLVESYKFHSGYNTLKYLLNGTFQLHVVNPPKNEYNVVGYVDHNLGYFPFAIVYAKDDLMANYQPLGRFQAGSGAYRQFYYYLTTTRLYFVVTGWSINGDDDYYVNFYYKLFRNNLGL